MACPIGTGGRRGDRDEADDEVVGGLPSSILGAIRYSDHTQGSRSKVYAVPVGGIGILQVTTVTTTETEIDLHVIFCFFPVCFVSHCKLHGNEIAEEKRKEKGRDVRLRIYSKHLSGQWCCNNVQLIANGSATLVK